MTTQSQSRCLMHIFDEMRDYLLDDLRDEIPRGQLIMRLSQMRHKLASQPSPVTGDDWQPIEMAPKDGTDILVYGRCISPEGAYYKADVNMAFWNVDSWFTRVPYETCEPTHWQPLPQPPQVHP